MCLSMCVCLSSSYEHFNHAWQEGDLVISTFSEMLLGPGLIRRGTETSYCPWLVSPNPDRGQSLHLLTYSLNSVTQWTLAPCFETSYHRLRLESAPPHRQGRLLVKMKRGGCAGRKGTAALPEAKLRSNPSWAEMIRALRCQAPSLSVGAPFYNMALARCLPAFDRVPYP